MTYGRNNRIGLEPLVFYIITLVLSAIVSWLLSCLASLFIFHPYKADGWPNDITAFINNISHYVIFLAGIAGCFRYNVKNAQNFDISEILRSVLSTDTACLIACVVLFLLALATLAI